MAHTPIPLYECHGFIEHYLFTQYLLNNLVNIFNIEISIKSCTQNNCKQ